MTRLILTFFTGLLALPALSDDHGGLMLAGCVPETGELFAIEAYGDGKKGKIFAASKAGTICTGQWIRLLEDYTVARMSCEDGRRANLGIGYFDPDKPEISASGTFTDGTRLHVWNTALEPECRRKFR